MIHVEEERMMKTKGREAKHVVKLRASMSEGFQLSSQVNCRMCFSDQEALTARVHAVKPCRKRITIWAAFVCH